MAVADDLRNLLISVAYRNGVGHKYNISHHGCQDFRGKDDRRPCFRGLRIYWWFQPQNQISRLRADVQGHGAEGAEDWGDQSYTHTVNWGQESRA